MPLVIVESPNKIPKIKKILGDGYVVKASVGHIMDLEKKDMGIDTNTWIPKYKVNEDKADVVKGLKEEAKKHDIIYVATDPDREGESISFNIRDILPKQGKTITRISFNEITKSAILNAIAKPVGFDDNLYASQQARRIIDRVVGFQVSPVMWAKGLRKTSAGRVQSAVLKWLVDREREIRNFIKEEYWTITAQTKDGFDAEFFGINDKKVVPKDKVEADKIVAAIKGDLVVSDYQAKTRNRSPQPPYITATLTQDASTKFGWTAKRVMDEAQSLFSQGLITYHRTDSTRIEPIKLAELRVDIESKFGKKYLSPTVREFKNSDASQDAHEAIRPSGEPIPSGLGIDGQKLLELIENRFTASQMSDAQFDQTNIILEHKNKDTYVFKVSGSIIKFDGFLKVIGNNAQDVTLPVMKKGQKVGIKKLLPEQHFTKAPNRFSEAALTAKMKELGIGRPSTYATVPETLIRHGYVVREKKNLKATDIGMMVCDYLSEYFNNIVDAQFTAKMEDELDNIKDGKTDTKKVMDEFYIKLQEQIEIAKKGNPSDIFKTDIECTGCKNGNKMTRKVSDGKVFLSCETYPICGHTLNYDEDGNLFASKVETGLPCPECQSMLVERESKYGPWLGCSSYPVCKWSGKKDANGNIAQKKKVETTDTRCTSCKDGMMVKRSGKDGNVFLGCNKYPKCKTTMNIDENGNIVEKKAKTFAKKKDVKSTGKKCPKCKKNELVERQGKFGIFVACSGYPSCKHIEKN